MYDLKMLPKDCVLLVTLTVFTFSLYSSAVFQFYFTSNILISLSEDLASLSTFHAVIYPYVEFCCGPFSLTRQKNVVLHFFPVPLSKTTQGNSQNIPCQKKDYDDKRVQKRVNDDLFSISIHSE